MSEDGDAVGLRERVGTLSMNWRAAKQATVLAVVAIALLYALQMGVTAAVTSGGQPMASVGEVPIEPQSSTWEDAPSSTVDLNKQQMAIPYGGGSTDELQVRALTNDSHVAFRMEWDDPTHDTNIASPENYSDAAAVMFGTGEIPPIMMGAVGDPVNIWYWRASWQENRSAYGSGGMYGYPNDLAGGPTKPGQAAGNSLSTAPDQQAQNLYAEGFGSTSDAQSQPVQAEAERTDDGWAVTFVRERGIGDEYDTAFSQDEDIYIAFAVWNGSADERNGQKSITLQYQKLNPESGALSEAESSSGGSDGSDGSGSGDGSDSDDSGGPSAPGLNGWIAILVGSVVMVWMVSYWRLSKQ
jgi:hypothetical protein